MMCFSTIQKKSKVVLRPTRLEWMRRTTSKNSSERAKDFELEESSFLWTLWQLTLKLNEKNSSLFIGWKNFSRFKTPKFLVSFLMFRNLCCILSSTRNSYEMYRPPWRLQIMKWNENLKLTWNLLKKISRFVSRMSSSKKCNGKSDETWARAVPHHWIESKMQQNIHHVHVDNWIKFLLIELIV